MGSVARASVPKPKPKPKWKSKKKAAPKPKPKAKVHHHTPTYYARLRAAQLRAWRRQHPKKGRKLMLSADAALSTEQLQLLAADR